MLYEICIPILIIFYDHYYTFHFFIQQHPCSAFNFEQTLKYEQGDVVLSADDNKDESVLADNDDNEDVGDNEEEEMDADDGDSNGNGLDMEVDDQDNKKDEKKFTTNKVAANMQVKSETFFIVMRILPVR